MAELKALIEAHNKKREEMQKLEAEIKDAEAKQYTELPERVGLKSVDALINALAHHASPRLKAILKVALDEGKSGLKAAAPKAPAGASKKKRTKITDELRAQVVAAMKEGGKTTNEIAKEFGISVPSVANIKKAAGLTRNSGKK